MSTQDPFRLELDPRPTYQLDEFALLACQQYNLGNQSDWFGTFRGGRNGMEAKVYGAELHFGQIHAWAPVLQHQSVLEYNVAGFLFCVDSAIECLVYAMNALGFAATPSLFCDPGDEKALKKISPKFLLDSDTPVHQGFLKVFPGSTALALSHRAEILRWMEQHDVSKHRSTISAGGRYRSDPPPGFFESLGIEPSDGSRFDWSPYAEVLLHEEPKLPYAADQPTVDYDKRLTVESVGQGFESFFNEFCKLVLADAWATIPLNHHEFLAQVSEVEASDIPLFEDPECSRQRKDCVGWMVSDYYAGHRHYGIVASSLFAVPVASGVPSDRVPQLKPDFSTVIGPTWYRTQDSGQVKFAWQSSALHRTSGAPG